MQLAADYQWVIIVIKKDSWVVTYAKGSIHGLPVFGRVPTGVINDDTISTGKCDPCDTCMHDIMMMR